MPNPKKSIQPSIILISGETRFKYKTNLYTKLLMCLVFLILTFQVSIAQKYALPFKGEDLKPGERVYTKDHKPGIQGEGKDIKVARYLGDKKWGFFKSGKDGKKNSDWVVYGKKIYAMADGTIVGCWCNAPENPRPGERHAQKKRIPGGGNELWVLNTDGTSVLYAHMKPGTIPGNLCPNKDKLFPKPPPKGNARKYVDLPKSKQVKIKKGQFLGRVGNSGSSSNPHLHVHMEKNGKAAKMVFQRGLYKKYAKANLNGWKSFAGKEIPDGQVLIWPPRTVKKEYARHGFRAKNFQRLFDHLTDSGYEPTWIDGYTVGGKPYLNFVFQKRKYKFRAYFGLNGSTYQTKFNAAKKAGFVPTMVDSYALKGQIRYNVIFKKISSAYLAKHGLTYEQHKKVLDQAKKKGLSPINISVASIKNQSRYTVLYRKKNIGGWQIKSRVKESAYQKLFNDNKKKGLTPFYLNSYKQNGTVYFTTIFAKKGGGALIAKHMLSGESYQKAWSKATKSGYRTKVVTAIDGASSKHRFAGLWRK